MKTSTFQSSLLVSLLAALVACGGGSDDSVIDTDEGPLTVGRVCEFNTREDMERARDSGVICRVYSYGNRSEDA